jgi:isopenicillin-N N-acyltransferase-like protein
MELEVLELAGTAYQLGYAHGRRYGDSIWRFAQERVELAGGEAWTGRSLGRKQVLALAEACLPAHREFTPDSVEELEGMAAATGLSLPELIVVNGFTDFVDTVYAAGRGSTDAATTSASADDCTAMLVPGLRAADARPLLGQTWDMHASAAEQVLLLRGRPEGAPEFLSFTSVGCVGMIGMNEAGLAVGINNLMAGDGRPGVMWTFAVRELLKRETLAEALDLLERIPLAGAHNYLLLDRNGNGANVEATGTRRHVTPLDGEPLVHTNHCLFPSTQAVERDRAETSLASSRRRLARASELLGRGKVTPDRLQAITADEPIICASPAPPLHVATCGAAIMRPATGELWAVKGRPSQGRYRRYTVPG